MVVDHAARVAVEGWSSSIVASAAQFGAFAGSFRPGSLATGRSYSPVCWKRTCKSVDKGGVQGDVRWALKGSALLRQMIGE